MGNLSFYQIPTFISYHIISHENVLEKKGEKEKEENYIERTSTFLCRNPIEVSKVEGGGLKDLKFSNRWC